MKFTKWLLKKKGSLKKPIPPIEKIDTADFNPSYKDSQGRLYMPHHAHYDLARELHRSFPINK